MNSLTAFPHLEPANANAASPASNDFETTAALERERDRILHITNYMEALYARLLVSAHGRSSVATIGETD